MTTKPYHYKESGLDYVYLLGGYERKKTPYGMATAIKAADELHAEIANQVITSPLPIRGQEVRFLRSVLQLSQTGLARVMGVDRSTMARWEGEPDKEIPEVAGTALRLVFAAENDRRSVMKQVMDVLRAEEDAEARAQRKVTLGFKDGWRRTAA